MLLQCTNISSSFCYLSDDVEIISLHFRYMPSLRITHLRQLASRVRALVSVLFRHLSRENFPEAAQERPEMLKNQRILSCPCRAPEILCCYVSVSVWGYIGSYKLTFPTKYFDKQQQIYSIFARNFA